ncbi:YoaK family protein [uncultured Cetobacterium sp.]|uniref:YoaK family protein n=2 Tax=uncultured Cetobacterium sp. TaxID=527638 RepID=UPI0026152059|nr:YoaK family protein [uncultured Cetobacterium sp.]
MERINDKLFWWISLLAFLGGGMNAFALLDYSLTVSHITGSITKISTDLIDGNTPHLIVMLGLVFSFFTGAICSGILIGGTREFELKKRYGDTFIIIGICLKILETYIYGEIYFIYSIAFLLGLQNGLFIRYRGMVIRTTHMTGTVTDLGVVIGHYIKGQKEIVWKMKYYTINILSFILGGFVIGFGFKILKRDIFDYLSIAYILSGAYYFFLRFKYYKSRN